MGESLRLKRYDPASHRADDFDCGESNLNDYLRNALTQDQSKGVAVGHVLIDPSGVIAGYFTLSSGELVGEFGEIPSTGPLRNRRSIPTTLLGRLAVDLRFRGQGIGEELLMHALGKAVERSREVASAVIEVDALHERAQSFYERYGFRRLPDDPNHLYLPMKTARKLFG